MRADQIETAVQAILAAEKVETNPDFPWLESQSNKESRLLINGLRSGNLLDSIANQYAMGILTEMNYKVSQDDIKKVLELLSSQIS